MPGGVAYKFSYDSATKKFTYIQYSDNMCAKPSAIKDIVGDTCYKFQPYVKAQPLWFQINVKDENDPKPWPANTFETPKNSGIVIIDNKIFANAKIQEAYGEADWPDAFHMPKTGGVPGFPNKFTLDEGITYRFLSSPSTGFAAQTTEFMCHAQKGLSQGPKDQLSRRGLSAPNLAFFDDAAMWCYLSRTGPNYDDDLLTKIGINRGAQPFKVEFDRVTLALGTETLDDKAYQKIRPKKCRAQCWKRSIHTCDDEGCFVDIIKGKCMTRDSCAVVSKVQDDEGIWGETCSGKYRERNLVPPPPPLTPAASTPASDYTG